MCEATVPINELEELKFSITSLASIAIRNDGSYDCENAKNAVRGIESRLDWVIRQLKAAGEGEKNMGA